MLFEIEHLSDADLLSRVHELTQHDHLATARFVAHLAELDSRRLYVEEGFPSLFAYCTQVLHFSEYTAYRRIESARVARRFPVVLERIADGSVHLTAVTLLAPHLTPENHLALLESARHRTRRQLESILAHLIPVRERPVRGYVVPLPPSGSITPHAIERGPGVMAEADARTFLRGGLFAMGSATGTDPDSMAGSPGDNGGTAFPGGNGGTAPPSPLPRGVPGTTSLRSAGFGAGDHSGFQLSEIGNHGAPGGASADTTGAPTREALRTTPGTGAGTPAEEIDGEDAGSYRLHVTIGASTYNRLERARLLMSHSNPSGDIATVLDRALGALVEILERRKFAMVRTPRKPGRQDVPRARPERGRSCRHITASVRRAVWQRDAGQCTFVGRSGNRCRANDMLEYHHVVAWSRGGDSTAGNLTLRCRAHNAHDAEVSMGRRFRPTRTKKCEATRTGASCFAQSHASCVPNAGANRSPSPSASCLALSGESPGMSAGRGLDLGISRRGNDPSRQAGHHPGTGMNGPEGAERAEQIGGSLVANAQELDSPIQVDGRTPSGDPLHTPIESPGGSRRADNGSPVRVGGIPARHAGRRSGRRSEKRRRRSP